MVANWLIFFGMAVYANCKPVNKPLGLNKEIQGAHMTHIFENEEKPVQCNPVNKSLGLNKEIQDILTHIFENEETYNISDKGNVNTLQNLTDECKMWNFVTFNKSLETMVIYDKSDGENTGDMLRFRLNELIKIWPHENSMESSDTCLASPKTPMEFLKKLKHFLQKLVDEIIQKHGS